MILVVAWAASGGKGASGLHTEAAKSDLALAPSACQTLATAPLPRAPVPPTEPTPLRELPSGGVYAADAAARCAERNRTLASILADVRNSRGVPALGALLWRDGVVIAEAVDGLRCAGADPSVTQADRWHIGSCTKAMTATLCAILVAEGKLSWDLTLAAALPDISERMRPEFRDSTLRELLAMRGRIPGAPPPAAWQRAWRVEGTPQEQRRRFIEQVLTESEPAADGTFEYSNSAYAIAGHLCEVVTGTPYETLLIERVAKPLGITSMGFGPPGPDQPCGHGADGEAAPASPRADNPPSIAPAGRVHLTLDDWMRFVALHLDGERLGAPALGLDAQAFATLHASIGTAGPRGEYALGWALGSDPRFGRILAHDGSNTMWYARAWLAPNRRLAMLIVCNQGGTTLEGTISEIQRRMIALLVEPDRRTRPDEASSAGAPGPPPRNRS